MSKLDQIYNHLDLIIGTPIMMGGYEQNAILAHNCELLEKDRRRRRR